MVARGVSLLHQHIGLVVLLSAALITRLWLLWWWNPFPFGDVFNFVRIAQELGHGLYVIEDKRLPFYPFLILVAHWLAPAARYEVVAIGISLIASLVVLGLVYAIARQLHFRRAAALVGVAVMASFEPFLQYSIRGYADTTFSALLLAAILGVLWLPRRGVAAALGVGLGALALTRYEGVLAGLVLFGLAVVRLRQQWRAIAVMALAGILTILPYVIVAQRSGRSLSPAAYLAETANPEEGYGVATFGEFWINYRDLWQRVGLLEFWDGPKVLIGELRDAPLGVHTLLVQQLAHPRYGAAWLALLGVVWLVWRRPGRDWLTLVLPYLAVAVPIAWYAPYRRYDALIYPAVTLAAVAGSHALLALLWRGTRDDRTGAVVRAGAVGALLFTSVAVWMLHSTHDTRDNLRKSRHRELAYYQAVLAARDVPGVVAFDAPRAITDTYFATRGVYAEAVFTKNLADPLARAQRLRELGVAYIVTVDNRSSPYAFLFDRSDLATLEEISHFEVTQGNGEENKQSIFKVTWL